MPGYEVAAVGVLACEIWLRAQALDSGDLRIRLWLLV